MRRFYDEAGRVWIVYDVSSDSLAFGNRKVLPAAFRDGWLVFERGEERRRLAPIPPEWLSFPVAALRSMLDRAELAPHRPPTARDPNVDADAQQRI